jgi:broad specificity phosphatase PhoE
MSEIRHVAIFRHGGYENKRGCYVLSNKGVEQAGHASDAVWKWAGEDSFVVRTSFELRAREMADIIASGIVEPVVYGPAGVDCLLPLCENEFWDDVPEGTRVVCVTHGPTMSNTWNNYFHSFVELLSGWKEEGCGIFLEIDLQNHTVLSVETFIQA